MKNTEQGRPRGEVWRERVKRQEESGLSVRAFCQRAGVSEPSFYYWRKQVRGESDQRRPVRFALVETGPTESVGGTPLELLLGSGHCLRISAGVDGATLRTVLEVLEARP